MYSGHIIYIDAKILFLAMYIVEKKTFNSYVTCQDYHIMVLGWLKVIRRKKV